MALKVYKKEIINQRFNVDRFALGNVAYVRGSLVQTEEKNFKIAYRYDGECQMEDIFDYYCFDNSNHLGLRITPELKKAVRLDTYQYYRLIQDSQNGPMLEERIIKPYLKGEAKFDTLVFDEFANLSFYTTVPQLTLEEALDIYKEREEDIKQLALSSQQAKKIWSKGANLR